MTDVIHRAMSELWDWETFGSFWNGAEVMLELVTELKAARAEIERLRDE